MSNLVGGRTAILALVGVIVAAVLAASGWLLLGGAHGKPQPRPSQVAAVPASPSALPSFATTPAPSASSAAPVAAVQPARLVIPRLGVQAPIENKGIDRRNQIEAPAPAFDVVWYSF